MESFLRWIHVVKLQSADVAAVTTDRASAARLCNQDPLDTASTLGNVRGATLATPEAAVTFVDELNDAVSLAMPHHRRLAIRRTATWAAVERSKPIPPQPMPNRARTAIDFGCDLAHAVAGRHQFFERFGNDRAAGGVRMLSLTRHQAPILAVGPDGNYELLFPSH
jgi:hypothetical protein